MRMCRHPGPCGAGSGAEVQLLLPDAGGGRLPHAPARGVGGRLRGRPGRGFRCGCCARCPGGPPALARVRAAPGGMTVCALVAMLYRSPAPLQPEMGMCAPSHWCRRDAWRPTVIGSAWHAVMGAWRHAGGAPAAQICDHPQHAGAAADAEAGGAAAALAAALQRSLLHQRRRVLPQGTLHCRRLPLAALLFHVILLCWTSTQQVKAPHCLHGSLELVRGA